MIDEGYDFDYTEIEPHNRATLGFLFNCNVILGVLSDWIKNGCSIGLEMK